MKTTLLSIDEVLAGYDAAATLYPHIPSMSVWRGWEYAGYRRFSLPEPVLDVGCGDGQFLRLLFPAVRDVVGIDLDPATVEISKQSGVYRQVHLGAAHEMDESRFAPGSFASAFANCALEHMDELPRVMSNIRRSLRPGAPFLFSVVTENWAKWSALSLLVELAGDPHRAAALRKQHADYHHLVNGLSASTWAEHLLSAGFDVEMHIPIVPRVLAGIVTLFDQLWHLPRTTHHSDVGAADRGDDLLPPPVFPGEGATADAHLPQQCPMQAGGELGTELHAFLQSLPNFPLAFRNVVEGAMRMEPTPEIGSGAIFWARRRA
jgi:SAM-dependent methyltransferase